MDKKRKLALAAAAVVVAAVPSALVVQDRLEAAERKSLEQAAVKIFQHDADLPTARWRSDEPPMGKVWEKAVAAADITEVEMQGDRAKVWVNAYTTPYVTDMLGKHPEPDVPYVGSHVFVFEPAGDGWRLAEDLTQSELGG
ncbi:hypothetical protein ACFWVC_17520 [Streptomyces sp. NPDC058691]|uniref:hypothetical protein n=1 Tax=Streptomyces sp. NPDC058691 TaxID=3346601 RepID=UPI00365F1D0E